ncbi:hypothetical protein EYC80_000398 [Monilinia laxa]|uniref:Uncharacterized protein n=1 Tax=Monilinia laxa TaxID=61186 RepID=A0A5N6KAN2_MONLA|nr:hypothetical protein EYC80_000398 [Monilinia laxa]
MLCSEYLRKSSSSNDLVLVSKVNSFPRFVKVIGRNSQHTYSPGLYSPTKVIGAHITLSKWREVSEVVRYAIHPILKPTTNATHIFHFPPPSHIVFKGCPKTPFFVRLKEVVIASKRKRDIGV